MNRTALIYAEAAVRSKRSDYLSLFDPQVQLSPQTLKRHLADPKIVREAVQKLKQAGFTVRSAGKYSISLLATQRLWEKTFNVKIVGEALGRDAAGNPISTYTVEGAERFGYIDTTTSDFKDLLAGIALSQPSFYTGAEDCPPRESEDALWPLCPEDILGQLAIGQTHQELSKGKDVHVVVIDSGFFEHDYLKKHLLDAKIEVDPTVEQQILNIKVEEYQKLVTDTEIEIEFFELCDRWCKDEIDVQELNNTIDASARLDALYEEYFSDGIECAEVTIYLKDAQDNLPIFRQHRQRYRDLLERSDRGNELWQPDPERHGTVVVTHLLTVAPQARVTLIKLPESNEQGALDEAFEYALGLKPDIISVSRGGYMDPQQKNAFALQSKKLATLVFNAVETNCLVLFASGNNEKDGLFQDGKGKLSTQAQIEGCIAVGGAYRKSTDTLDFTASDFAHGYLSDFGDNENVRAIPDICGLCGPKEASQENNGFFSVPRFRLGQDGHESTWGRSNGTSIATPQVAGVCALMKQVFPKIDYTQAIKILRETAEPVGQGQTAQGASLDKLGAGVVNIEKAVTMAYEVNLGK